MKVHFLGIAGSGASAAAAIAKAQGFIVTGCDKFPNNEFTKVFKPEQLLKNHDPSHIGDIDILAITPALTSLDPNNPELLEAKKQGIEVLTWQEFTGKYLMESKFVIAIAGTHGKTTTTAMVAKILEDCGEDPTVIIGAIVPAWRANYRVGKSKLALSERSESNGYFVIEADEYNDNFLPYKQDIAVLTNIEMDHPEYFKDLKDYEDSFFEFLLKTKRAIVANLTDPGVTRVLKDVMKESSVTSFDYSKSDYNLNLKIPGEFNKLNATAAYCLALMLDLDPQKVRESLESYQGVGRRFEYLGDFKGAKVYSDFGHHPTEIKTTMEAARQKFPDSRIWLIYEPHMFTRTLALFDDFVKVFKETPVDKIIITDIYQSREVDKGLITSQQLADAISDNTIYQSRENLREALEKEVQAGDILFFMGAGDIDKLAKELLYST